MAKQKFGNFVQQNKDRFVRIAAAVCPAVPLPLPVPLTVALPALAHVNGPGRGVARDARCQSQTTVSRRLRQLQTAPWHAHVTAGLPPAVRDAAKSLAI